MSQKQKSKIDLEEYRHHVVTALTVLKVDSRNVKETLIELRSLLREQNGRIRKNEKSIARIFGIGGTIMAGFSALIGWLFNK